MSYPTPSGTQKKYGQGRMWREEPLRVCVCEGGRGGINKPLTQNTKALNSNSDLLVESTGPSLSSPLVQVGMVDLGLLDKIHWSRSG